MSDFLAARAQMEVSLAFHMLFAAAGMGIPILLLFAEGYSLRTGRPEGAALARKWAKALAVLFVVGAVSGTALSFEIGLLWPAYMEFAGPMIGPMFALEGYAFFIEAIFLGIYLYSWDRLSPLAHWLTGIPVAIGGLASGIFVLGVNSWMQAPSGFTGIENGVAVGVDPVAALFNPAWGWMATHSTLAALQSIGFAMAGIYAFALFRNRHPERRNYNRLAIILAMILGGVSAFLNPLAGDQLGVQQLTLQPAKLAASEGLYVTQACAPFSIGGIPNAEGTGLVGSIEIPCLLSLLATRSFDGVVPGLDQFPPADRPSVLVTHTAFQIMVGLGMVMMAITAVFVWGLWRERRAGRAWDGRRWLLAMLVVGGPMGYLALQAGWIVTEVGRQPWVIYDVMRTADAITPVPGTAWAFYVFSALYLGLTAAVLAILFRLARVEPAASATAPVPEARGDALPA